MLHNNPTPTRPDTHCTRVTSSDRFISAGIALGDLLYVRPYTSWHQQHALFEVRFRHGSMDVSMETMTALVRMGQEAIVAAPKTAECSGAVVDLGEPA